MKKIIILTAILIFSSASTASACQSARDCSGRDICCMGTLWQDQGGFGDAGKSGSCMSRKECYGDGGTNTLYNDDVECGKGAVYCTVSGRKGKIKGCFPSEICDKDKK